MSCIKIAEVHRSNELRSEIRASTKGLSWKCLDKTRENFLSVLESDILMSVTLALRCDMTIANLL